MFGFAGIIGFHAMLLLIITSMTSVPRQPPPPAAVAAPAADAEGAAVPDTDEAVTKDRADSGDSSVIPGEEDLGPP